MAAALVVHANPLPGAVVHTPITGRPLAVTFEMGTCRAIECTLRNLVVLTPAAALKPRALG